MVVRETLCPWITFRLRYPRYWTLSSHFLRSCRLLWTSAFPSVQLVDPSSIPRHCTGQSAASQVTDMWHGESSWNARWLCVIPIRWGNIMAVTDFSGPVPRCLCAVMIKGPLVNQPFTSRSRRGGNATFLFLFRDVTPFFLWCSGDVEWEGELTVTAFFKHWFRIVVIISFYFSDDEVMFSCSVTIVNFNFIIIRWGCSHIDDRCTYHPILYACLLVFLKPYPHLTPILGYSCEPNA